MNKYIVPCNNQSSRPSSFLTVNNHMLKKSFIVPLCVLAIYVASISHAQLASAAGPSFTSVDPHTSLPVTVVQGQSAQVNQIITANDFGAGTVAVLIDMEVKNAANQKVAQNFYDDQTFTRSGGGIYVLQVPPTLPVGNYTVDVGIFSTSWNSLIQWIGDVHAFQIVPNSNGTTTPAATTTSSATIQASSQTVREGTSVDFNGKSWGIEENVAVTDSNRNLIAIAHADGGGNSSTGSIHVPMTIGDQMYTFRGSNSGIVLTSTVHVGP